MNNNDSNKRFNNNIYQSKQSTPLSYDLNTTHPIIPNSQDYTLYKKYVSIHSEDRDAIKYPNSSQFEIELPEDYLNVATVRLANWTFPANYSTFSVYNSNVRMTFQISNPYNPGEHGYSDALQEAIFAALYYFKLNDYAIEISGGFYNPDQMVTELTNKFNAAVTQQITDYLVVNIPTNPSYAALLSDFTAAGGYNQFVIVYNSVKQNIWFGNRSSGFKITNNIPTASTAVGDSLRCLRQQLPDYSNYGLPSFLGFLRCNVISTTELNYVPRFFYGDVFAGDNGYWLLPDDTLPGCQVSYFECPYKINLMGPSHMYMEIDGLNCIDETSPYNLSKFTLTTNQTNGIVNSSFAKIPIPTTPMSQWFDKDCPSYKLFLPPAERLRKLRILIRYHNGESVNFGSFNYTFTLEFTLYSSQQMRTYNMFNPT
jgi:hypothetical protein